MFGLGATLGVALDAIHAHLGATVYTNPVWWRLAWWTPEGQREPILGGRDLSAGGTWMGLTARGRFALVTNVRRPDAPATDGPSRGAIVPAWLSGDLPVDRFWPRMALSGYAPFNLIAADFRRGECYWASNQLASGRRIALSQDLGRGSVSCGVDSAGLADAVRGARATGFRGFNLSMPHKVSVVDLLDEVSPAVRVAGACSGRAASVARTKACCPSPPAPPPPSSPRSCWPTYSSARRDDC